MGNKLKKPCFKKKRHPGNQGCFPSHGGTPVCVQKYRKNASSNKPQQTLRAQGVKLPWIPASDPRCSGYAWKVTKDSGWGLPTPLPSWQRWSLLFLTTGMWQKKKKGERKKKKKAAFLGVALQTLGNLKMRGRRLLWVNNPDPHCGTRQRHPAKLEPNQCAYCKQERQWKRQCPDRPQRRKGRRSS